MTVRIKDIRGTSGFFKPGDEIIAIGPNAVDDQLDLLFQQEQQLSTVYTVRRPGGSIVTRRLSAAAFARAALVFEEMHFSRCRSRCIFCFVDQMPHGLRSSLYEKDDDYRLSFLFGNYITLSDAGEREIRRIVDHNLSPLYISVHAIDPGIRERLFGRPLRRDILATIERLAAAGITMHLQVVLVPGINDGAVLERTVDTLFRYHPACRSIAVVPVGLTAHREHLPKLQRVTEEQARCLVDWAEQRRRSFTARCGGESFLHLADELYLIARRRLPTASSYDGFPQIANGVGMCRVFISAIERDVKRLQSTGRASGNMTVVTGTLGARFLRRYVLPLVTKSLPALHVNLLVVSNKLFGRPVTVSGLLAGADIIEAARSTTPHPRCLVVAPNALNHRGRLIDDMLPGEVSRTIGVPVIAAGETFLERRVLRACRGGGVR